MPASSSPFPSASVKKMVRSVLPSGRPFKIRVSDSGFDESKIVRVITPAWSKLQRHERISKFLEAEPQFLTPEQKKHVLRYSVLTPKEYEDIILASPVKIPSRSLS